MGHKCESSIDIDAAAEELFAIVTDLETYPEWVSDVQEVKVHDHDADGFPTSSTMTVDASIKVVTYRLDYTYEYPTLVSWTSRPGGDVKHIEGSYTFEELGDGSTTVTYALELDPGFPVPGFMLKRAQKHIIGQALKGLKARAES